MNYNGDMNIRHLKYGFILIWDFFASGIQNGKKSCFLSGLFVLISAIFGYLNNGLKDSPKMSEILIFCPALWQHSKSETLVWYSPPLYVRLTPLLSVLTNKLNGNTVLIIRPCNISFATNRNKSNHFQAKSIFINCFQHLFCKKKITRHVIPKTQL